MQAERLLTSEGDAMQGPLLLTPAVFGDERGFFFESWNSRRWSDLLEQDGQQVMPFVQDNHSRSARGVLRGLHLQVAPQPQAKLVRCSLGEIFDVAVDLRGGSPSFGKWVGARLSASKHQQLWVPVGFAHGFLTLSEHAEVLYKTSHFWNRDCERSLRWDDPSLSIDWPLEGLQVQLSGKDAEAPLWAEAPVDQWFP